MIITLSCSKFEKDYDKERWYILIGKYIPYKKSPGHAILFTCDVACICRCLYVFVLQSKFRRLNSYILEVEGNLVG